MFSDPDYSKYLIPDDFTEIVIPQTVKSEQVTIDQLKAELRKKKKQIKDLKQRLKKEIQQHSTLKTLKPFYEGDRLRLENNKIQLEAENNLYKKVMSHMFQAGYSLPEDLDSEALTFEEVLKDEESKKEKVLNFLIFLLTIAMILLVFGAGYFLRLLME